MGNLNGREDEDGSSVITEDDSRIISDLMKNDMKSTNNFDIITAGGNCKIVHNNHDTSLTSTGSAYPALLAPQVPVAPMQRADAPPSIKQLRGNDSTVVTDLSSEDGIPTLISWNYGGKEVFVEGSWDNWKSRKQLQRSGKDHSILLVLSSGIYHYKFIVDGEWRYIPELPSATDVVGHICNLLDVHDYVPEIIDSVTGFECPPSPDSSYSQTFPTEEELAKDPLAVPQQLHLTILGAEPNKATASKPQHVVLNHLFMPEGWASQSVVALGLTHRFESKYVTVVIYKPQQR